MRLKRIKQSFLRIAGNYFGAFLVNVLCSTVKINIYRNGKIIKPPFSDENFISVFWHGKMLVGWYIFRNQNFAALVSLSKDGEILSRVLKKWNFRLIRGSSAKGGKNASALMIDEIQKGYSIAVTPDGPTGPREKFKPGAVILSKKTGRKIILAGVKYHKFKQFRSWDNFQLPMPFSRADVVLSAPISIDENLSYDDTSKKIIEMEEKLKLINKEAENCSN